MNCEILIESVGSFGLYQKLLGIFLCLIIAPFFAFNDLTQFLLFLEPNHSCITPTEMYDYTEYSGIFWFLKSKKTSNECNLMDRNGNKTDCVFGHQYNYSYIYPTIVSENDWVCEESWKLYFVHTIYWTGSLLGVHFIGSISDHYGRVPAIAVCHLISAIAGVGTVFLSHNFIAVLIARALMGFVVLSQGMFAVVLVMEFVGISGRMIISSLFLFSYSITATILPWIAYYVHNWRILCLLTSVPLFSVPIMCFFIPESLRWLISKGKVERAEEILKRIAKINGKTLTEDELSLEEFKLSETQNQSLLQLFSYKRLLKIILITNILWALQNIGYTGVNIYAANVSNSPFVMLSINSALDVIATFFSNKLSDTYGRRITTIISCFLSGLAYISAAFVPLCAFMPSNLQLYVLLVGRLTFTCGYNVQYIYAAEVYPTVIRSRALALRLSVGSVGNLISPQIVEMSVIAKQIPLIIFGFCAFMASGLMFALPETLNKSLPETLENGNKLGKQQLNVRRRSTFVAVCMAPVEIPLHYGDTQPKEEIHTRGIELKIYSKSKNII